MLTRHCTIPEHIACESFRANHVHDGVKGYFRTPRFRQGDKVLVNGTFNTMKGGDFCGFSAPGRICAVLVGYGRYRIILDTGGNVMADESDMNLDRRR